MPAIPRPKKRRVVVREASARAANAKWGFAGMAAGGHLNAYTAEHYARDVERGVIVRTRSRGCPRQRPELECVPEKSPGYYTSSWRRRVTPGGEVTLAPVPAIASPADDPCESTPVSRRASTGRRAASFELYRGQPMTQIAAPAPRCDVAAAADPFRRPRRPTTKTVEICFDCKTWIQWLDRRDFIDEVGDDVGYAPTPRLADAGDMLRATEARATKDLAELLPLTGPLPLSLELPLDWFRISNLAAAMRSLPGVDDFHLELAELLSRFFA